MQHVINEVGNVTGERQDPGNGSARKHDMPAAQFEVLADLIGPSAGPLYGALRAYFVSGMTKAEASRSGGVTRPTMTKYVARWEAKLGLLASVEWDTVLKRYHSVR